MKERAQARVKLFGPTYDALVARVGTNVRRLREARGWTQEECAYQCKDLGPALLRTIEAGRTNITAATLARLCDGLQVDVAQLFAPADPPLKRKPGRPKGDRVTDEARKAANGDDRSREGTGQGEPGDTETDKGAYHAGGASQGGDDASTTACSAIHGVCVANIDDPNATVGTVRQS